ncbi:MAG: DUF4082 domain-containing protein [Pseudomonadota bacterium]|nr:DUF4082 domain-containing protein [Pseudomonadota bacterium]
MIVAFLALTGSALAGQVQLAWDTSAGAAGYRVYYGNASAQYSANVDAGNKTTATVSGLTDGGRYYFAVQAYNGTVTSSYSNEVSTVVGTAPAPPTPAPPVASFTASQTSGTAPLTVTLADTSTGAVTGRSWDLGDGTSATSATVVKTYTTPGTYQVVLSVTGAGVTSTATKTISVGTAVPVAQFSASPVMGTAPLQVGFADASTGIISSRSWTFGDGGTSTLQNPSHTYTKAGLYTVTLSVSGPGGVDTLTRSSYVQVEASEVAMEVGELLVNHLWQRVDFAAPFTDPIVVAQSLSSNGAHPAVVRVDGVDPNGFSIRVQEWDYLDGSHAKETVSYIVMERGYHQLPGGSWVEAGWLETSATKAFVHEPLSAPFAEVPVVLAGATSTNEGDAVTTRLRNITVTGFEVGMREQELNTQQHLPETIDYIAWEPSFGVVNGLHYEVGLMGIGVTHKAQTLVYQGAFAQPPLFLADMQSTAGGDTANLRWSNRNEASVDVRVSEEQSRDAELGHVAESVGYLVLEPEAAPEEGPTGVCTTPCSLWDDATTPSLLADPDTGAVELGVKFRSDVDGLVTGIRFYKSSRNTGTHIGSLWSSTGQLLTQATFTNETTSGWQSVDFATPVAIQANTVYVASYHTNVGGYSVDEGYLATAYANGPLRLLADGESGGNGLYLYGAGGFPTETYRSSNYWVDVVFTTQ